MPFAFPARKQLPKRPIQDILEEQNEDEDREAKRKKEEGESPGGGRERERVCIWWESGRVGASPKRQGVRIPDLMPVSLDPDVAVRTRPPPTPPAPSLGVAVVKTF